MIALSAFRPLASALSGARDRRKLQILIYHRVLDQHDPLQPSEPAIEDFRWQMALLAKQFNVLPLSNAVQMMQDGCLPPRAACITFDDGYADNLHNALPVLNEFQLPATIFVATGFLDGGIMFNDIVLESVRSCQSKTLDLSSIGIREKHVLTDDKSRLDTFRALIKALKYLPHTQREEKVQKLAELAGANLPGKLMMSGEELSQVCAAGIEIGAHTVTHPILKNLDDESATKEITESRQYLENHLKKPVTLFAYPNGVPGLDYSERTRSILSETGFAAAVSTAPGYSTHRTNPFELHRFTPWDRHPARFYLRLLKNYAD